MCASCMIIYAVFYRSRSRGWRRWRRGGSSEHNSISRAATSCSIRLANDLRAPAPAGSFDCGVKSSWLGGCLLEDREGGALERNLCTSLCSSLFVLPVLPQVVEPERESYWDMECGDARCQLFMYTRKPLPAAEGRPAGRAARMRLKGYQR